MRALLTAARRVTDDGVSRDPAWTPATVSAFTVTARTPGEPARRVTARAR